MPIIHFINNKGKTQTRSGMKKVLDYVSKLEKTQDEDKRYVTTLNCSQQTAFDEMLATKNLYHKNDGRLYYHLVQSFPKDSDVSPDLAHKIAVELAEKSFDDFEVVVATHIDRDHIHSHFLLNSVSFENGKKYHSNLDSVKELMSLSDEICLKYGVGILKPFEKKQDNSALTDREYRSAVKGESWKFQLMNAVTEVMKTAKSKKQFSFLMSKYGYNVRWEDSRKYITYTCPNGRRCRDNKLHDTKFLKEMMEYEFKIRHAVFNGAKQNQLAGGSGNLANDHSTGAELECGNQSAFSAVRNSVTDSSETGRAYDRESAENLSGESEINLQFNRGKMSEHSGTDRLTDNESSNKSNQSDRIVEATGWEVERGIFLEAERIRKLQAQAKIENVQSSSDISVGVDDIIGGIANLITIIEDEPNIDFSDCPPDIDRKDWVKIVEKKQDLGMRM